MRGCRDFAGGVGASAVPAVAFPGVPRKPQPGSRRSKARAKREAAGSAEVEAQGKCGAVRSDGKACTKKAGAGTEHVGQGRCKLHGGNTPAHQKAPQLAAALEAVEHYGLPRQVDPHTALLEELARTAGHVDWLRVQVGSLDESALVGPVGTAGVTPEGMVHHPKAEASIWLRLYQGERKHLAEVAAACIKAGIAERQVRLAEQQGQLIAQVLQGVLRDLKLDPAAPKTREVVRKHLALVSSEAGEANA